MIKNGVNSKNKISSNVTEKQNVKTATIEPIKSKIKQPRSKSSRSPNTEKVEDRLIRLNQIKNDKLDKLRQMRLQELEVQYPFAPKITIQRPTDPHSDL